MLWGRAQKVFIVSLLSLVISTTILVFFIGYLISCSTARPKYSVQRLKEHMEYRQVLVRDFGAQHITFTACDGVQLVGLLLERPHAARTLLICHGYRMSKERLHVFARLFPHDNIFLFDYRAHGESAGNRTSIGYHEKKDVLAAVQWLQQHEKFAAIPIVGIGVSMGAVSLCAAASECNAFKALVFDSPFAQLDKQAKRVLHKRYKLPTFPFEPLGRRVFSYLMNFSLEEVNTLQWIGKIQAPILLIHSKRDDTASFDDAQLLYKNVTSNIKDFWVVEDSGHARIFADHPEEYRDTLQTFLSRSIV